MVQQTPTTSSEMKYGVGRLQCNTILQLNGVGIMHFHRGHMDEANECFRSALLVLKRQEKNYHSEPLSSPLEECRATGDPQHKGTQSTVSDEFLDPSSQPRSITAISPVEIVDECQTLPETEDENKLYGSRRVDLLARRDETSILEPIELKEGHFPHLQGRLSARNMDESTDLPGRPEDIDEREQENFSFLVMMILIFNLGVVMQTKATLEDSSEERLNCLDCALRLYECVYACLLAAQEQLDKDVEQNEEREDEITDDDVAMNASLASSIANRVSKVEEHQEKNPFFALFHHTLLLCLLHNMGLVLKQIDAKGEEASQCYQFLFSVLQRFHEEDVSMSTVREEQSLHYSNLLPSSFNLDMITRGVVAELKMLSDVITAPCA